MRRDVIAVFGKSRSGKNTIGDMLAAEHSASVQIAFADKVKQICGELFGLTDFDMNTNEGKAKPTRFACPTCPVCRSMDVRMLGVERLASFYDQPVVGSKTPRPECRECGAIGEPGSFTGTWTPRTILQHIATEGFRRVDPMVWARHAMDVAASHLDGRGVGATDSYRPTLVIVTDGRFWTERAAVLEAGGAVWRVRRPETDRDSVGIAGHASETELDAMQDEDFASVIMNDGSLDDLRAQVKDALAAFRKSRTAGT